jgi:hypothetical protein
VLGCDSPISKGTFAGSAFFSGGLAFLVLLHRRRSAAVLFASLALATLLAAWVAVGQSIGALAKFFIAQGPIISGYSEAMSADSWPWEAMMYAALSLVILGLSYQQFGRRLGGLGRVALLSLAFTLFVGFKASFVREHIVIGVGLLSLTGYCAAAMMERVPSLIIWACVVFNWVCIDTEHTALDFVLVSQRLNNALKRTFEGIAMRTLAPQELRAIFDGRNAAIRALHTLPIEGKPGGSADLYPFELSTLFAQGLSCSPRPIIQSYSHTIPGWTGSMSPTWKV